MSKLTFIVLCAVAASLTKVFAISEEELSAFKDALIPMALDCFNQESNSDGSVKYCVAMACIMKKSEILTDKGLYDAKKGFGILKNFITDDPDDKIEKFAERCSLVNDVVVSDGETGCDRAMLLLSCILGLGLPMPIFV